MDPPNPYDPAYALFTRTLVDYPRSIPLAAPLSAFLTSFKHQFAPLHSPTRLHYLMQSPPSGVAEQVIRVSLGMVVDKVPGIVESFFKLDQQQQQQQHYLDGEELEEKMTALVAGMESFVFTATYKIAFGCILELGRDRDVKMCRNWRSCPHFNLDWNIWD